MGMGVLEQEYKGTDEIRDTRARERDREQEDDARGCEVEQDECEHESPENHHLRHESDPPVDDPAKYQRGHDTER